MSHVLNPLRPHHTPTSPGPTPSSFVTSVTLLPPKVEVGVPSSECRRKSPTVHPHSGSCEIKDYFGSLEYWNRRLILQKTCSILGLFCTGHWWRSDVRWSDTGGRTDKRHTRSGLDVKTILIRQTSEWHKVQEGNRCLFNQFLYSQTPKFTGSQTPSSPHLSQLALHHRYLKNLEYYKTFDKRPTL